MSLISVEDALARLLGDAHAVSEVETVMLRAAYGRILAEDLKALRTQPSFDASAMDGYALRADDVAPPFRTLRLIGESAAGRAFGGRVSAGEAVRIFTGAPVPPGADAILIQENAERPDARGVLPLEAVVAGRHIRQAGADFREGETLVAKGTRLASGTIALAASGGYPRLSVLRRPRVAILATGDELVMPGETVGVSQIVACNTFGVAALVEAAGAEAVDYGIAPDDEAAIGAFVDRAAAEAIDVLVTIGGASVGDHDLVGRVFAAKGVGFGFWKVAMRPGKPLMAGKLGAMHLVGLPGNPASSLVTATLFLKPLVHTLTGRPEELLYREGLLGSDMPANDHRADFIRATIDRSSSVVPVVQAFPRQDSSLLSVYAKADVLLWRAAHAPAGRIGDTCRYITID